MSRLIVKNLPAYITQDKLRAHFEDKNGPGGTLTDVKVVFRPDGTSRRFGFVGFKTDAEAQKAQKWFDKTFIHSARINVSVIEGAKDAPTPRPNKRPRLEGPHVDAAQAGPSKAGGKKVVDVQGKGAAKDSQLEEFMEVMQQRSKGPSWKNTDFALSTPSMEKPRPVPKSKETLTQHDGGVDDDGPPPDDTEASDMDWLKRRVKSSLEITGSAPQEFTQPDDEDVHVGGVAKPSAEDPVEDNSTAAILQTGRLFLRNLSFSCTEEELLQLFKPFGEVAQVHIPLDSQTKASKGMGYVTFANPTNAVSAFTTLDKKSFQGRLLHLLPAVSRKGNAIVEASGKRTLKEERDAKKKSMAGKEFNWAMLYMNSDAVASSIADRMNIAKADILNPESDNAAVKLALAETHVIQETKSFLEQNGVILSSLSGPRVARNDTVILVKNIPYGTTADQIRELFEPHGQLRRVLVPPAGTMAVVEFVHPDEGRKAFRAVAYRRMGNSVIYLEKGPVGMFVEGSDDASDGPIAVAGVKPVTIGDAEGSTAPQAEEPSLASGTTLFVKNLSFATTAERFTNAFRHLPDFAFARVQTKPDPKRPGATLSMGYGFVGFRTSDAAKKALKSMEGYALDGHALVVKFAGRGAEEEKPEAGTAKGRTTKMIVKNVPFEATKKDIRELFGAHGQLKSVRLPKKFDHRSRGFAFLEFLTRHEAENAYAALKHTHLLGRHLVLQWAEEDGEVDLDELRKKAGVGFGGGKELPGRKRKLEMGDGDADDAEEIGA